MGLKNWLTPSPLKAQSTTASMSLPLAPQWDYGQATGSYAGFAAEGFNGNTVVNAAIREIATSASLPAYRLMAEDAAGDAVEIPDSEAALLLGDPNEGQAQSDFVELLTVYLMVTGNTYVLRERNGAGHIVALRLLRPDRIEVKIDRAGLVSAYKYTIDGVAYWLGADDVAHLKLPNPYDDVYGLSPLQVASRHINLDTAVSTFLRSYFSNAGVPAGILKVSRRLNSQEEADSARAKWRSSFSGNRGWHGLAVLDEDAEYQQVAPNLKDMDASAMTRVTETRICAVFGVPPILLGLEAGLERSTYSNYEQARSAFWDETISPLARRIAAFLQRVLEVPAREPGRKVTADFSMVPAYEADHDAESARVVAQYQAGIVTLNEARGVLGFDPLDEIAPAPVLAPVTVGPAQLAAPVEQGKQQGQALPRSVALGDRLLEERDTLTDDMEFALRRYFSALRSRIAGVLGRAMQQSTAEAKIAPDEITIGQLFPAGARNELSLVMTRSYQRIIRTTWDAIAQSGVAGVLEFNDRSSIVSQITALATSSAEGIDATSRTAVSRAIETGVERGYSIQQVARGVPAEGFPGLNSLVEETYQNRARTIARTEVMRAQNATTIGYYREQGIQWMRAHDPDGDPDDNYIGTDGRTCAERHNLIYTADDSMSVDSHPNCRLTWTPISLTQAEEMGLNDGVVNEQQLAAPVEVLT
jgi:HK97 family phage portal protein